MWCYYDQAHGARCRVLGHLVAHERGGDILGRWEGEEAQSNRKFWSVRLHVDLFDLVLIPCFTLDRMEMN